MAPSDQTEKPFEFVQTSLFGEPEIVQAKPKRKKRQGADRVPPAASPAPPSRWQVRLRLWRRSVMSSFWWLCGKARDKALELVVGTLIASGAGYLGLDAWLGKSGPATKAPPVIEKGWEPKVQKAR